MPNVNPGQTTIVPGIVTSPNQYPQYGVGGGTPGSSAGWHIVTADNNGQKIAWSNKGYLTWFSSRSAANKFISDESSFLGSGGSTGSAPSGSSSACALHIPGFSFGPVGWGGWCVISKTALRGFVGGSLMVAGGIVGIAGLVIAASHAFSHTSTGQGVITAGTAAFGAAGAPGRALNSRLVSNTARQEGELRAQEKAAREQQRAEDKAAREQERERREVERAQREEAKTAPARGRHAKPAERGGRHRKEG